VAEDSTATKKRTKRVSKKTATIPPGDVPHEQKAIESALSTDQSENPVEIPDQTPNHGIESQPPTAKKTTRKRTVKKQTTAELGVEGVSPSEVSLGEKKPRAKKKTTTDTSTTTEISSDGIMPVKKPRARKKTVASDAAALSDNQVTPSKTPEITPSHEVPMVEKKEEGAAPKPKSMEEILERIPSFSGYLLNRMSKEAQKAIRLGVLEINRMKTSDLEKAMEHLTPVRMFFDASYENEKEILDFLEQKIAYMNKILEQLHEKEGEALYHKEILEPLAKGKFEKIIRKWGPEISVDECAYQILDKIGGRTLKKIPLSEFVLRKKLIENLKEKYPEKTN
jgi:hypothetical protein